MLGRIKNRMRRAGSGESTNLNAHADHSTRTLSTSSTSSNIGGGVTGSGVGSGTGYVEGTSPDYNAKLTDLASFDACVEACDALAASSSYAQSSVTQDPETGMKDCSVLVSPDGDLLLLPSHSNGDSGSSSDILAGRQESDEYTSSVFMGNDLKQNGDRTMNGFTAVGWSATATSLAMRQTEASLRDMTNFVEEVVLSRKEAAARTNHACDQFLMSIASASDGSGTIPPLPLPVNLRKNDRKPLERAANRRRTASLNSLADLEPIGSSSWNNGNSKRNETLELVPTRVGPLRFSGGTLHAATVSLEQYHSLMAERDGDRWRKASIRRGGVLADLISAADQAAERAYHREKALKDIQRRANEMEAQLYHCKDEARQRWQAVHDAEERVTQLLEERLMLRSQQRERQRLEKFRAEQSEPMQPGLGATTNEIWDIVSAATAAMEDGDFTPLDLPQASAAGPRDVTNGPSSVDTSLNGSTENSRGSVGPPLEDMVQRGDIELECQLPDLRAAAMAADDAIEETSTALLSVLSTLDTTRRSAKVAAETSLLSACNAQASCIRAMVAMEKEALTERLAHIEDLERVASNIDVRADLDAYIEHDKKERGGSTWLGADDDGGMASALAVLSSHVDGSTGMGMGFRGRVNTDGWDGQEENEITPEILEDAVSNMFIDEVPSDRLEESVSLLCKVAEDRNHPSSRSRRSTICYALNSKRIISDVKTPSRFEAIGRVIRSILTGCERDPGGVANAKMCMMLAQTFYKLDETPDGDGGEASPRKVFLRTLLLEHPIWADEEYWDQALYQCVTESLTHSGVMTNFERSGGNMANRSEWTEQKKLRWHDLSHSERCEAASQVHAVVFAQLGALAHSMMEFGCGLERSCAFVRRMSVRNQLPLSQRTMLLQHVMKERSSSVNGKEGKNEPEPPNAGSGTKEPTANDKPDQVEEPKE